MKNNMEQIQNNDRITIVKGYDVIHFYYESANSKDRLYLFTQKFSKSVYEFFRLRGKTIGEIYSFSKWYNPRLSKTIMRILDAVEYAWKETVYYPKQGKEELVYEW